MWRAEEKIKKDFIRVLCIKCLSIFLPLSISLPLSSGSISWTAVLHMIYMFWSVLWSSWFSIWLWGWDYACLLPCASKTSLWSKVHWSTSALFFSVASWNICFDCLARQLPSFLKYWRQFRWSGRCWRCLSWHSLLNCSCFPIRIICYGLLRNYVCLSALPISACVCINWWRLLMP